MFHGVFIGIDRYASPGVDELRCARRDATALEALFADTLGGETVILTDNEATRDRIEREFALLAGCAAEDVVVIGFSGHGSETHELVTHDADLADLRNTCIQLETLTEWFAAIPARRLVCVLDCCFSGGMGAKVLHVPVKPRSLRSAESLLDQLSGEGRIILTASRSDEEAWENGRVGHGLLTYYFLQALQGAEEVRQAGKVSVYRLLEYISQRVTSDAAKLGAAQHPTLRGSIDRELTWPVFTPGPRYARAFPERTRPLVTADLSCLAAYGFSPDLIAAWARSIPGLNELQLAAINDFGVLDDQDLVVSAPTSSGKTMVGELAALRAAVDRKRSIFLLPLKALVNDKHQQFTRTYGGFGLRVTRCTGEIIEDVPGLLRGRYDICLMTYEKFTALLLGNPHLLSQVATIVIDEVQMIADPSRGVNLEFLVTLLRMYQQRGLGPQLVALSAVIGDTNGFERWLGARLLRRTERPVPLDEGLLLADGSFRYVDPDGQEQQLPSYISTEYRKGSSQDWIIPLVRRLVSEGKQVIVFRETKGDARGCALYLARSLGLQPAERTLSLLPTGDPSNASGELRQALAGGVGFHIADLDRDERMIIEERFRARESEIRVVAATTTLAMGVNTPAEAVVIAGLEHPGHVPYSVAEYKNMVGRAGRLGMAERGTSFLLAVTPRDEGHFWDHYVLGSPEDLQSRFLAEGTDPRSLILRVLAVVPRSASHGLSAHDIVSFLESSFGAYQEVQRAENWSWDHGRLVQALSDLEAHRLIELQPDGTYRLTDLGRIAGEAGVEVESIIRLVDVFRSVQPADITDPALVAATQLTRELGEVVFPLNRKSTEKEPLTWTRELRRQAIADPILQALRQGTLQDGTLRAKKAVSCLLWITGHPLAEMERILTQFSGRASDAAGPIRSVATRSCDLLPTVVRVAEILHPQLDLARRVERLLARLEVGVPSAAADLARHLGSRLLRADYLRLLKADLHQSDRLEAASDEELRACVDGDEARLGALREYRELRRQEEARSEIVPPILPEYEE